MVILSNLSREFDAPGKLAQRIYYHTINQFIF